MSNPNSRTYVNPEQGSNLYKKGVRASNEVAIAAVQLAPPITVEDGAITTLIVGTHVIAGRWYVITTHCQVDGERVAVTNNGVELYDTKDGGALFRCNGNIVMEPSDDVPFIYRINQVNAKAISPIVGRSTGASIASTLYNVENVDIELGRDYVVGANIVGAVDATATSISNGGAVVSDATAADDGDIVQRSSVFTLAGTITANNGDTTTQMLIIDVSDTHQTGTVAAGGETEITLGTGLYALRVTSGTGATGDATSVTATLSGGAITTTHINIVADNTTQTTYFYAAGYTLTIGGNEAATYHLAKLT